MNPPKQQDRLFVELVDRYLDRVYRYLCNLTRDDDLARDLCHETFLNLRGQVDSGTPVAEAYVFTTARNAALGRWRRERREADKHEAWGHQRRGPSTDDPSSKVENRELSEALHAALQSLTEEQRSVFLLLEVERLTYEQTAEILGTNPGTVASRKHKAVRILREEMKRLGHELP